jgi:hypothetical protein
MEKKECPSVAAGARHSNNADEKSATNKRTVAATQAPVYIVRLRSLRGDGIRELRAILKTLLRRHAVRCLSIEVEEPQP